MYLHKEISIEKAVRMFLSIYLRPLVSKVFIAMFEDDLDSIDTISKFVKEMQEEARGIIRDEGGQLSLPFVV